VCDDLLYLEARFPTPVRAELEQRGHTLHILDHWGATGSEVMVQVDPATGALLGAADPRRDGYAIGW
jgi:gamma-glutamyltranspeptidase/glutathione hydrolase